MLSVLIIGLPVAYWFADSRPEIFETIGVIGLQGPQGTLTVSSQSPIDPGVSQRLDEIEQSLMARENLVRIINDLNLFPEITDELERVGYTRDSIAMTRLVDPGQAWRPDVQPLGLSITVQLDNAEKAAELANALMNSIVSEDARRAQIRLESATERATAMVDFLTGEEARVGREIAEVETQIAQFRTEYANSLPENLPLRRERVEELKAEMDAISREIADFERVQDQFQSSAAESRLTLLEDQRQVLEADLEKAEAEIANAPEVERDLGSLVRRLQNLEAEQEAVATQRTQAGLDQSLIDYNQAPRFAVLDPALPPAFPISADKRKLALAGAAAVGLLALGLALGREMLNPVIRTPAQMMRFMDIEPVVAIPYIADPGAARRRVGFRTLFLGLLILVVLAGTAANV
jgi:tyrosine-protein kinase Etk/Wzc